MIKKRFLLKSLSLLFLLILSVVSFGQTSENELQYRTNFGLSFSPIKKVKLEFSPELRFDKTFSVDRFHIETGLSYKPLKYLSIGGSYRFVGNLRESKSTEYLHKFALNTTLKKSFSNWTPSLRLKYTNYTDESTDNKFLRYKAKLAYNIPNNKITPNISVESYQDIANNEFYKMRYAIGADYKLKKNNYIQVGYKYDYYLTEFKSKHIITAGYKLKF